MKIRFLFLIIVMLSTCFSYGQLQVCITVTDINNQPVGYSSTSKTVTLCGGETIMMNAANCDANDPSPLIYEWRNTSITNGTSYTNAQLNTAEPGVWVVRIRNLNNNTEDRDTVFFENYARETFEIDNDLRPGCENSRLVFRVTSGKSNYNWYEIGSSVSLSNRDTLAVIVNGHTEYIAAFNDQYGCTLTDTVYVRSLANPVVNLGQDQNICYGESITLVDPILKHKHDSLIARGEPGYTFLWSNGSRNSTITLTGLQPGTYSYWLQARSINGCTGTDTVGVTVHPIPLVSAGSDTTICYGTNVQLNATLLPTNGIQGTITYEWKPLINITDASTANPTVTPIATTTYTVITTNQGGCKDSATVTVYVNPEIQTSTSVSNTGIICRGDSVTLSGLASGGASGFLYTWKDHSLTSISSTNTVKVSPNLTSWFYFYATDAIGCTKRDSASVNVSTLTVDLGNDLTLCGTSSVTLTAATTGGEPFTLGEPYTYLWEQFTGNGLGTDRTSQSTTVSPTRNSTYKVTVTDAAGCTHIDLKRVNIDPPSIEILNRPVGDTIFLCRGSNVQVNATTQSLNPQWSWTPTTHIISGSNTANPVINFVPDNTYPTFKYIVSMTDECNITVQDSIYVKTVPSPPATINNTRFQVCSGFWVRLFSVRTSPDYRYTWTTPVGTITDTSQIYGKHNGSYWLTVENQYGCSTRSSETVVTDIEPTTIAIIEVDSINKHCNNAPISLSATSDGVYPRYRWRTSGKGYINDTTARIITYTPSPEDPDTVFFNLMVRNPCDSAFDASYIQMIKAPHADFISSDYLTYPGKEVSFTNKSINNGNSIWIFHDGSDTIFSTHTNHTYTWPGTYPAELVAFDQSGCSDTTSQDIEVTDKKVRYVPLYFSPASENPDNAALKVFGTNVIDDEFHFSVYNRWGEVLYETSSYHEANKNGWDGTHPLTSSPQASGVYTWTLKVKYFDGTKDELKGTTTLVK